MDTQKLGQDVEQVVTVLMQSNNTGNAEHRLHVVFNLLVSEVGLLMRLEDRSRNERLHKLLTQLRARVKKLLGNNLLQEKVIGLEAEVKAFAVAAGGR